MRRRAKIDRNQPEIVEALRSAGASVQSLAQIGNGCPDLVVGIGGQTYLIECKDGGLPKSKQALTPDQIAWHAAWNGSPVWIIRSAAEGLDSLRRHCDEDDGS